MDFCIATMTMPIWSLLICSGAILLKIESPRDPVLFKQRRSGKDGRRFEIFKLRTMHCNSELKKQDLMKHNQRKWPDFKIENDPRITPVGRLLRKSSIDELPQFINVLRGEMSLVGPRPTSFAPDTYELWQTERLDVVPGLTGLWQIMGRRHPIEFEDRVRLDIAYIHKQCLWVDFQLFVRSFLILHKGA